MRFFTAISILLAVSMMTGCSVVRASRTLPNGTKESIFHGYAGMRKTLGGSFVSYNDDPTSRTSYQRFSLDADTSIDPEVKANLEQIRESIDGILGR